MPADLLRDASRRLSIIDGRVVAWDDDAAVEIHLHSLWKNPGPIPC